MSISKEVQNACDYAVKKITEQGEQCIDDYGNCSYGDGKGNHCAVGWIIDNANNKLMAFEGGITEMYAYYPEEVPPYIVSNLELFYILQCFHDGDTRRMRERMLIGLKRRGLDISAPQYQQWIDMGK